MQVTGDSDSGVVIGSGGSMTAKTLSVTGTATVTGTLTAGNDLRVDTNTLVVDAANDRVGIGTTTPATLLAVGTTTNILNVTVGGSVGIGTTTPGTALYVIGTITATGFSGPGVSKTFIRKSSAETVTSSTTLQDDDELLFAIAANETWHTDLYLAVTSAGAADFKYAFTAPAGLTSITYGHMDNSLSVATSTATGLSISTASSVSNGMYIKCLVVNGANAGTVTFQWAQNTSDATTTRVQDGSFLVSERLR
jgi:hypothetical protein